MKIFVCVLLTMIVPVSVVETLNLMNAVYVSVIILVVQIVQAYLMEIL